MQIRHFIQPRSKYGRVECHFAALGARERACHDEILPPHTSIQAAGEPGRNDQPRPIGVNQGLRSLGGARPARSRLDQHDLAIAAPSLPCNETVAADHAHFAEHIDEAPSLNGQSEYDADADLLKTQIQSSKPEILNKLETERRNDRNHETLKAHEKNNKTERCMTEK